MLKHLNLTQQRQAFASSTKALEHENLKPLLVPVNDFWPGNKAGHIFTVLVYTQRQGSYWKLLLSRHYVWCDIVSRLHSVVRRGRTAVWTTRSLASRWDVSRQIRRRRWVTLLVQQLIKADRLLTRDTLNAPWLLTNGQFQWTGNGHSQLRLAELGKPSPNIDLLRTTGSNGRAIFQCSTLTYSPRLAKVKVDPRAKNQGQTVQTGERPQTYGGTHTRTIMNYQTKSSTATGTG